jgi:cytochrome c oxidase cbb3-type subunit IV
MDVNTLRALLALVCFALFVGICVWAYSGSRRERFADAARVPLMDEPEARTERMTQ